MQNGSDGDSLSKATDGVATLLVPSEVRYIKLGAGGRWEAAGLDGGHLEYGGTIDPVDLAASGDWDRARAHYREHGRSAGTATAYARELRDFYTLGSDALWITFALDHLWWAFAEPDVVTRASTNPDEARLYRRVIGGWRNTDLHGRPIRMIDLSTRLTQVASYQQTMCKVTACDYLLRRVNGEEEPNVLAARLQLDALAAATLPLIQQLHQSDFELMVDLLFMRTGWRRISTLGGTMKANDLVIEQPATGERANVQVKSAASQSVLDDCISQFLESGADRFFFICHSPRGDLVIRNVTGKPVAIWSGAELARQAIGQGMVEWLMARAA